MAVADVRFCLPCHENSACEDPGNRRASDRWSPRPSLTRARGKQYYSTVPRPVQYRTGLRIAPLTTAVPLARSCPFAHPDSATTCMSYHPPWQPPASSPALRFLCPSPSPAVWPQIRRREAYISGLPLLPAQACVPPYTRSALSLSLSSLEPSCL